LKITASKNGPYLIEVTEAVLTKNGTEEKLDSKMIALCRCGHSANLPFCDGTHEQIGFEAEEVKLEVKGIE